ncbi:hypothetical protein MOO46_06520 [Apilactobacillus apisilvae]|uniref:Surface layer protein A domain-containing protein n=1 Tax=Apilactobacillus apisilvae TaxID=2923364 RepID=A0ABY4PH12_9LACO|nr:hypothetical protein [Apilactobacillus apisilvae]UQS84892.1 hypothetical protein MOO46_06520 [Apilactobacillus apisilvae]
MNFKKNVAAVLTGITLASIPAMSASANGMPKNNSNYWNQNRYIKVNKNVSANEKQVKNNTIQNKTIKKMNIKKGTVLVVSRIKNNHNQWILQGIKGSKNSIWVTNQKNTNWMSKYTPKKVNNNPKLVKISKNTAMIEKEVKNNTIQSKTIKSSTLKKGSIVYTRQLGENEWLVYGNNLPGNSKNGAWIVNNKNTNWMSKYTPKKIDNSPKLVKTTKQTNIVAKEVKNNTIQNKTVKKANLKKGSIVYSRQLGENEWLIYGNNLPASSKNTAWIINDTNAKWMSKYTPKPIDNRAKVVSLTTDISINEKAVKNNTIQNNQIKSDKLKAGSIVYTRQIGENEWLLYGHSLPATSQNGAWITNQKDTSWMKKAPVVKSNYSSVESGNISKDNYIGAYLPTSIVGNNKKVLIKAGQKVQVKKIDNNTESIRFNGQEFTLSVGNGGFATRNNAYPIQNGKSIQSTFAPNNVDAVVLAGYKPENGSQWYQSLGNGQFKYFTYSSQDNGWVYLGTH